MELIDEHMASPHTDDGRASPDRQAELLDVVASTDRMLASVSAMRACAIDQLRVWSESTVPAASAGVDAGSMARRSLVAELACVLRIPEGSAQRLPAESETLVQELGGTRTAAATG